MLGRLASRAVDALVLLLALYAFAFVPLGSKTALDHVKSIAVTGAAREAAAELGGAGRRLLDQITGSKRPKGTPLVAREPTAGADAGAVDASATN